MFFIPQIKSTCAVTVVCAALGGVLAVAQAAAPAGQAMSDAGRIVASDPFIGTWKLDPSRSKLSDEMKVQAIGENKYAFDFGSGKIENIVTDGTDQTGQFGTTLAVTIEGPNRWNVVRKQNAHTIISAHWELSNNGNLLTDHYTSFKPDGSANPTEDYAYKRTAGSTGFAGTWESTMEPHVFELHIQPFEGDGLSFVNSDQQSTRNIKFDGKDYPVLGPNIPAGFASTARRANPRLVQITDKMSGEPFDTQEAEISADGRTLSMTQHLPSQSKPKIYVFQRQ